MNDEILDYDDTLICDECEREVNTENDLYPYEDMNVCIRCHDKLKLRDEQDVIKWETEEYNEYDY